MLEGDENETFKFCLILARKMIGRRWFGVKFKKKKKKKWKPPWFNFSSDRQVNVLNSV